MRHNVFCDIGQPETHVSKGILDTGPGYVLTGDYETSFLAPNHYDVLEDASDNKSVTISDLLRQTVPEFEGRRGRFMISVVFVQDPYGDGVECELSRQRICYIGRLKRKKKKSLDPEDCCETPKESP